jgi:hypothetical protein
MINSRRAKEIVTDIVMALIKRRAYGSATEGRIKYLIRLKQLGAITSPSGISKELEDATFHGFLPVEMQDDVAELVRWLNSRIENQDTFPIKNWRLL